MVRETTSADEEAIHVLKASWSHETQPETLGAMASRHLDLRPMTPAQLGSFDTLPLRPDDVPPAAPADAPQAAIPAPAAVPTRSIPARIAHFSPPRARVTVASATGDAAVDAVLHAMGAAKTRTQP
jgi:hypothetical protein